MMCAIVDYTFKTAALVWSLLLSTVGCFVFLHGYHAIAVGEDRLEPGHRLAPLACGAVPPRAPSLTNSFRFYSA
jgi:hypothetical protein